MDPISHAVIGTAVAGLLPAGAHPALAVGILIGAEIPDIDILVRYWGGRVAYLKNHRGATHGLIIMPVYAAVIAALLNLLWPGAGFGPLFGWSLLGVLSHLLFDFGNDYGTQGLWPFSTRWIAFDLLPIVDFGLLGLIGLTWSVHALWPVNRQALFVALWLLIAVYVALRFGLRRRAWQLAKQGFDLTDPCGEVISCGPGWHPERLSVHPTLFSLNAWRYVVQLPEKYSVGLVWVKEGRVGSPHSAVNQLDRVVQASRKSQVITAFADWARRPRVEVEHVDHFYHVRWSEMRYEVAGLSPFTAYAWLDEQLNLVDEGLGFRHKGAMDKQRLKQRLRWEMGRQ